MTTVFEKQGQTATSYEPLSDWLEANGIDVSVSSYDSLHGHERAWNAMLAATATGDIKKADEALTQLRSLERDGSHGKKV